MTLSPKIARALNQAKGSVVHSLYVIHEVSRQSNRETRLRKERRALTMLLAEQIFDVIL
jgi:hypothetical protein